MVVGKATSEKWGEGAGPVTMSLFLTTESLSKSIK